MYIQTIITLRSIIYDMGLHICKLINWHYYRNNYNVLQKSKSIT